MNWLKTTIRTTRAGIDIISGSLLDFGITGFEIEDFTEFEQFIAEKKPYWDDIDEELIKSKHGRFELTFYLPEDADNKSQLITIETALKEIEKTAPEYFPEGVGVIVETIAEESWADAWKQYYHPFDVGRRLTVCPVWEPVESKDRVVFRIDPGMAFGTGSHASTKLCLEALDKSVSENQRVLDIGCGSGILFISALLLGAAEATAVELDPTAADIACRNAELNTVGPERYKVFPGDILTDSRLLSLVDGKYDIICCNIVADVIIKLLDLICGLLSTGGMAILSGIIDTRLNDVLRAIENSKLFVTGSASLDGWELLLVSGK